MNKALATLLAVLMGLSLVACGAKQPKVTQASGSVPPASVAPPAKPYTALPLAALNASCQEDYYRFLTTLNTLDESFFYLYITTPDGLPVANVKGFSQKSWESYAASPASSINGLSMNSGLLPFLPEEGTTSAQTLELVLANTDTVGEPILQRLSIPMEAVKNASPRNALQIIWEGETPQSTLRQCPRTLSYQLRPNDKQPTASVAGVLMNLRLYSHAPEVPTNPQVGPTTETTPAIHTDPPKLYKDVFDPHYSDEKGLVTFRLDCLPTEEELMGASGAIYMFEDETAKNIYCFSSDKRGDKGCSYPVAKDKHSFLVPRTLREDPLTNGQPSGREAVQIAEELVGRASYLLQYVLGDAACGAAITGENGASYGLLRQQKYHTLGEVAEAFESTFSQGARANTSLRSLPEWLGAQGALLEREGSLYINRDISLPSLNQSWYPETATEVVVGRGEMTMKMDAMREKRSSKTLQILYENGRWVLSESYFDYAN